MKRFLAKVLSLTLLTSLFTTFAAPTISNAVVPVCESGMSAQAGLKAEPGHGKVFYIDSGVTPKVDASYVSYKIYNSSGAALNNIWVSLENFAGGKVALANIADQYQQIESVANSSSKTVFYLLKAFGATTTGQQHTVKIFDRRPDLVGSVKLLECTYKFTQVRETIKANSNKIDSVRGVLSGGSARLGGTLTVTVAGSTGKVGSGTSSPDGSIFWASPAAMSNWPTRALRLESTSIVLDCRSGSDITLTDTLAQLSANTCFTNPADKWTGTYVFRIIGPGPSSLTPSPIAQLASGTQIKHSDINGLQFLGAEGNTATPVNLSGVLTSTFRVSVTASSTVISSTAEKAVVEYTVVASTTSTTEVKFDEFLVDPADGMTYVSSSATIGGSGSPPVYLSTESAQSSPPLHWIGPFAVTSTSSKTLVFRMEIPCSATPTSYLTIAYAKLGDQILGYDSTRIEGSSVQTTTSGGSCTATPSAQYTTISPTAQTRPATSVTTSTATLNGYANAYNVAGVKAIFRYSTDPNLLNSVTTTAEQSVTGDALTEMSQAITGLSASTIYYFRIEVGGVLGTTLNFTTEAVQAQPSVVTLAASNLAATTATLNGTINPNLTAVSQVRFYYSTNSDMTSPIKCGSGSAPNYCVVQTETSDTQTGDLTLSGSGEFQVLFDVTGLSTSTRYYFRVSAICVSNATYCPGGEVLGNIREFRTGSPEPTTLEATVIGETTTTLNGSIKVPSGVSNANWKFVYCAAGAGCSSTGITGGTETTLRPTGGSFLTANATTSTAENLTGLTGNTLYYYQLLGTVAGTTVSFGEILSFRTILITTSSLSNGTNGSSYNAGIAGAGGSNSYSFSASGLPTGISISSSGLLSGTPTIGGNFTPTFTMNDLVNGTSTQRTINLVILSTVTYTLNGGSGTTPTQSPLANGASFNLAASTGITRTGFTFSGWFDGTDTKTAGSSYTMGTSNLTFSARWTAETYTVTYNGNSPTSGSTTDSSSYLYGDTVTVLSNGYVKTSHTFLGWNTADNGSGINYSPGATFAITENTTLYARWKQDGQLSVTYVLNGGTGSAPTQADVSNGTQITVKGPANGPFSRDGHQFLNWANSAGGSVGAGESLTVSTDITLTANWQIETRTVTYFPNGADVTGDVPNSATQNYNTSYTVLGNVGTPAPLARIGYTFNGWNAEANGTGTNYSVGQSVALTNNLSLHAKWSGVTYTVTYDGNSADAQGTTFSSTFTYPSSTTIRANGYTRTGFTFVRWYSNSSNSGGTPYSPSDNYSLASNITLYAIWTSDPTYSVTYDDNVAGTTISVPTDGSAYVSGATVTVSVTEPTRSGYTFGGWTLNSGNTGTVYRTGAGNTNTYTMGSANITFYAIWTAVSGGTSGGGGGGAPAVTPTPKITSLSKSDTCSIATEIIIYGSNLEQATVTLDGVSITTSSVTASAIVVTLPAGSVGKKTLRVSTANGSDSITIDYLSNTKPSFQAIAMPYLAQDLYMSLPITATNATSYSLVGTLPTGISLNSVTGELSGTPRENGIFSFSITANSKCGSTTQDIEIDIDKPTPNAISHRILFQPGSCVLSASAKASLDRFLEEAKLLAPRNLIPEIYLSGVVGDSGAKADLEKCRQDAICDLLLLEEMLGTVLTDVFEGSPNRIEIIIYWPRPVDVY